jgi:ribosomal protein S26
MEAGDSAEMSEVTAFQNLQYGCAHMLSKLHTPRFTFLKFCVSMCVHVRVYKEHLNFSFSFILVFIK